MTIQVGETLPDATFTEMTGEGPQPMSTADVFGGRKVVLFAVPGAFTPTCNRSHLPGFIENVDALKAKGVDSVVCVSVNDAFVMDAWAKQSGGDGKVQFLADGSAEFATALGLELDASAMGMGTRSRRYSMIVEDRVVKALNIEPKPGQADVSGATAILDQL